MFSRWDFQILRKKEVIAQCQLRINGVILLLQYDKQWGLAFQNYRKIQVAARAILIIVSMHHTFNEGGIKQLKNSPFTLLMWKHKN